MDLPRKAAPHRGSLRHPSDGKITPETLATPSTPLCAEGLLWPPAPGDSEQLQAQNGLLLPQLGGEGHPSMSVHGAQQGTPAPSMGTHLPTSGQAAPPAGAGPAGSSPRGTGRIWSLPFSTQMSSELPREFLETKTGCFQAASRPHRVTRPELASPPPSPALLRVLPSGHCLLIDAWKQTQ